MLIQSQMDDFALQLAQPFIARLEALVPLADAVLDHADQHCRAFPIATAPTKGRFSAWDEKFKQWFTIHNRDHLAEVLERTEHKFTHWRPLSPPPSNPPLPAVFVELGAALEKLKEGK
jgi:hypothetical protein